MRNLIKVVQKGNVNLPPPDYCQELNMFIGLPFNIKVFIDHLYFIQPTRANKYLLNVLV